jgi:hypothetical protein
MNCSAEPDILIGGFRKPFKAFGFFLGYRGKCFVDFTDEL